MRDNDSSKIEIMPNSVEVGDDGGHLYGCDDDVTGHSEHDLIVNIPGIITQQLSRTNY